MLQRYKIIPIQTIFIFILKRILPKQFWYDNNLYVCKIIKNHNEKDNTISFRIFVC